MGVEYKILFKVPSGYDPSNLSLKLPAQNGAQEVFSYVLEQDGFYFIDHLVDKPLASIALRSLIDEALKVSDSIEITEP
jgi:hypothetical protein